MGCADLKNAINSNILAYTLHICKKSFVKPLKTCYGNQNCTLFHGRRSKTYYIDDDMGTKRFLQIFAENNTTIFKRSFHLLLTTRMNFRSRSVSSVFALILFYSVRLHKENQQFVSLTSCHQPIPAHENFADTKKIYYWVNTDILILVIERCM